MKRKNFSRVLLIILALAVAVSAQTAKHPLKLDDLARFRNVSDPQISPDGQWIAYTVSTIDTKEDKSNTHIWMVGYDAKNDRQITFSNDSENSPRWSPDGKFLSFTSSRPGKSGGAVVCRGRKSGRDRKAIDNVGQSRQPRASGVVAGWEMARVHRG